MNKGFTKMPTWIANDGNISAGAKAMLLYLIANQDVEDFIFRREAIYNAMGVSVNTYDKCRQELIDKRILINNEDVKRQIPFYVNKNIWKQRTFAKMDKKTGEIVPEGEVIPKKLYENLLNLVNSDKEYYAKDQDIHFKLIGKRKAVVSRNYSQSKGG